MRLSGQPLRIEFTLPPGNSRPLLPGTVIDLQRGSTLIPCLVLQAGADFAVIHPLTRDAQ